MKMLVGHAGTQRKFFGILCALSMLLISLPVSNGTSRNREPKLGLIETNESAAVADATFEKVWVEYDVKVDEKKGMRIHAKFIVKNSLGISCRLIAQFYTRDGSYLKSDRPS